MRKEDHYSGSRSHDLAWLAGATLALSVARSLPATFLDNRPSLCLFRLATGRSCPGCGMSRALWHLLHGNFRQATSYNWRVLLLAPLLACLYLRLLFRIFASLQHRHNV